VDCRGHLFNPEDSEAYSQNNHSLVVNCWLSLVECLECISLICKNINLPLSKNALSADCFLNVEHFNQIGNTFISTFTNTKHNGVIEKGAFSFNIICKRLLSSGIPELCQLPAHWLQKFLDLIVEDKKNVLRRSAGLPWAIMAILTAEPTGIPKVLLPKTMNFFLEICESDNHIAKVHALHILTFIFRESSLSEFILQYVEKGFMVVLQGFNSQQ
jgi:thyroid adenoma-associated protein